MIGPEGASAALAAGLDDGTAARCALLARRLGLAEEAIPVFKRIDSHQPGGTAILTVNDYPALLVVAQELVSTERVDVSPEGWPVYRCRYRLRVFSFVLGADFDETDLCRKRLALVIRETLLADHTLGDRVADLDEAQLREVYSDVERSADGAISGTITDVVVAVDEVLDEPAPYAAGPAEVDVEFAPIPHPALD